MTSDLIPATTDEHELSLLGRGSTKLAEALRTGARWLCKAELPDDQNVAFGLLDRAISGTGSLREGATTMLCVALRRMKEQWERGEIPLVAAGEFKHDFYRYVEARTGYVRATVDNYIDIAEVWLNNNLPDGIPPTVDLCNENGRLTGETVQIDPFDLNVTKLYHLKANVRDGSLAKNPVALGQLFNPKVGYRTVKTTLGGGLSASNVVVQDDSGNYLTIWVDGPHLMARAPGDEEPTAFGEIYWDTIKQSDTARKALRHIADASGLHGWID